MLKIKKGLKKKIKGKKDKGKGDDLFDPEQLEKFRKELEEKRKAAAEDDPSGSSATPKDEEWLKFQALTAGVDSILQKTTTNLDKIKESSFYQRKQPIIPDNWHEAHSSASTQAASGDKEDPTWIDFHPEGHEAEVEESTEAKPAEEFVVPESPEEPEALDDSLFDTSYLDAIASGEIQLAYIPDSPTEEEGDDPFDTSGVADVVKQIEEAEKQAKRQVNLGNAVDFYSGKGGQSVGNKPRPRPGDSSKKARPRPRAVNLLGDDEGNVIPSSPDVQVVERPKDLLDELLSSPTKDGLSPLPENIPVTLVSAVPNIKKDSANEEKDNILDILGEFDEIKRVDEPVNNYLPSSTAALLASVLEPQPEDDEFDEEFAALATESINKNPSPLPPSAEDEVEEEEEEDPFDTTFVEKVAPPGKCELKNIESELLGGQKSARKDSEEDDFDPRIGEAPQVQRNLLEDHSPTGEHPPAIEPHFKPGQSLDESLEQPEADPFDTSTVEAVLPGKAELKLLEEELLKHDEKPIRPKLPNFPIKLSAPVPVVVEDDDDFDFDPRQGEPKEENKGPDHLFDTIPTEDELAHKVLTPQIEPEEIELDPFDTSIASSLVLVPGQLELRLLESELVESEPQEPIKRELSDPEFDPRGGEEPDPFIVSLNINLKTEDIFDLTEEITSHKVLTPQQETAKSIVPESSQDYDDPFDTSAIEVLKLLPASELKQIEGELLNASAEFPTAKPLVFRPILSAPPATQPPPPTRPSAPQHLFETDDPLEQEIGHKPLTPVEVPSLYLDPFDTSIAEGVVPGLTEIKILEKELLADGGLHPQLSDQDFNPRGPQPIHPSALSFVSKTLEPTRASDQSNLSGDIDPFDTSFAVDNTVVPVSTGPGKAELQALEAELL